MERDDGKIEFHHQHLSYGGLAVPYNHLCDRGAKPSEIKTPEMQSTAASGTVETSTPDLPSALGTSCGNNTTKTRKRKSRWDNPVKEYPHSRSRINVAGDEKLNTDEDAPPGFSSPCNGSHRVQSDAAATTINHRVRERCIKQHPVDIISGDSQLRFVARMPLSYGVSYSVFAAIGKEILRQQKWNHSKVSPPVGFAFEKRLGACREQRKKCSARTRFRKWTK
ncbi:UNVERIFIED_CONTAM: hypothetical protein Sradi_5181700 [Sesamum radiatum]|uniref:Uncharacterized protein n=1 Tax=Sesamum radiatum TaxID=300843 RepID=A0AAW2M5H3_SESRA